MGLAELRALLDRHARPDMSTAIEGVLVSKVDRQSQPAPSMTGSVMALIAQGAKRIALGDRVYEYRAGQYLVASVDLPVTGHFTKASPDRPALGFGLVLHPATVAELLLQAGPGDMPPAAAGTPSALAVSDAPDELVDAVIRLLRLLDRPRDAAVLAPLIKREILWRLITGEQGSVVRQLGLADSSLTHVARAVRWIREHYAQAFRVEEVAQLAGMSVSAFYRNFQAVTAMSPIQFQKQIRLQEARLLLATNPGDVTGVGARVGYDSASQFSREYRRQFGAPPSQDAVRLRDSAFGTVPALI
ncbi:AraC family transcriptional regulator [Catellatospora chokoriensis]|uniref:AraC family transcriptional regulator n=1 Tax=Catellatospora chokoriensis TaxID=310353 RepID=A0A8J3K365_9ACTN|nr:AraC family transcriptional regulator [Catellatospora chokoriensis]GIF92236.1 AraC family transcriptional regulator [Catellatospora chokoriensis]